MIRPPLKVLVVEDNPADARLARELLLEAQPDRFEVTHAPKLGDAFAHLRAGGFNAIILDLGLPDCQGLETLARARAEAGGAPIIVLTGLDDESIGRILGATDDLAATAQALIDAALNGGSRDNVTAVVVRVDGELA